MLAAGLGVPLLAAWPALLSGCGAGPASAEEFAAASTARSTGDAAAVPATVAALCGFGGAVAARLAAAAPSDNLVFSPWSLGVVLAMARLGARGRTATAMDRALRVADADRHAAGLAAIHHALAGHVGAGNGSGDAPRIVLEDATSMWGQRGLPWRPEFLTGLARTFGTGVRLVDYRGAPEEARGDINAWTQEHTGGLVPEVLPAGLVTGDTRITLVQAMHLLAPWETPFDREATGDAPFRTAAGAAIRVPTMHGHAGFGARGPGWVAARRPYAGGGLAMTVVLPDAGREAEVAALVRGAGLPGLLRRAEPAIVDLAMPRFALSSATSLAGPLAALGLDALFSAQADLSGMTDAEALVVGAVEQRAVIRVDEAGAEAAASTAVTAGAVSAPARSLTVHLDRPFHAVVHDVATGAPLFVAFVADPRG